MFLSRLWLVLCLALASCSQSPAPPPEGHLRVVSWNLKWFPGGAPNAPADAAASQMQAAQKALAELRPGIVLAQEVRDWAAMDSLFSVVPGLQVHVVSDFAGSPQNQAIGSLLPADSAWSASWKQGTPEPPRGYSFAAIPVEGGRFLLVYSLHLKSNRGDLRDNIGKRAAAVKQLLDHAQEMLALYQPRGGCGLIIGGDLNTSLDDPKFDADPSLRALRAAGLYWTHESVPFASRTTIPAGEGFPDNCFDHVLTLGLGKPVAQVVSLPEISDHNPVIVDIDLDSADFKGALNLKAAAEILASVPPPRPTTPVTDTLSAGDHDVIRDSIGRAATVRGKVSNVSTTKTGTITFINFQGNTRDQFVAIVRQENLPAVAAGFGGNLSTALLGKTIHVRGKIILYRETPEIVIDSPDQITIAPE